MFESKEGAQRIFLTDINLSVFLKPILSILFTGLIILLIYYTFMAINPLKICNDGSLKGECSLIQPYYCEDGKLIERASICGCSNASIGDGESCITKYQTILKNISLKYTLRGYEGEINYTVYKGLIEYLDQIPISISYDLDDAPSRQDFKIRKTYEPAQKELVRPLITKIQEITPKEEDQFRIAVSLIQNIEFGYSNKTEQAFTQIVYHERYPYEVLYDQQGICGEKSALLALILKEMGYDVSIFYFKEENHEAVGVKCPIEKSINNSRYCFIETTGSSIITDNEITYIGGTVLQSEPEVMQISKGGMINKNMYEYDDAETLKKINKKIKRTGRLNPLDLYRLNKLKEKYKLAEFYDAR